METRKMIHEFLQSLKYENRYICIRCKKAFSAQLAKDRAFLCPCAGYLINEVHI